MSTRRNRFSVLSSLVGAAIGAALLAQASPAAADAKNFNGAGCFYNQQGTFHIPYNRSEGQFQNSTTSAKRVICPLVKENLASTMRVFARVSSTVVSATCRVYRRRGSATPPPINHNSVVSFSDGTKDVEWTTPIAGSGSYSVQCDLPAGASIFWIQTAEP